MSDNYPVKSSNNPFVDFTADYRPDANSYMQYDETTGDQLNCAIPQRGPMEIALANTFSSTAPSFSTYSTQALGNCDISLSPTGDTKELYNDINIELQIFIQLYRNSLSGSITNTADLVPSMIYNKDPNTTSNYRINCPTVSEAGGATLIPYLLEYKLTPTYSSFARFCMTEANASKVTFDFDYYIYPYLSNVTGTQCLVPSCSTALAPFLGYNTDTNPVNSSDPVHKNEKTITYILAAVGAFVLILLIGIVIAYAMKIDKKKLSKAKNVYNNPIFSKK